MSEKVDFFILSGSPSFVGNILFASFGETGMFQLYYYYNYYYYNYYYCNYYYNYYYYNTTTTAAALKTFKDP